VTAHFCPISHPLQVVPPQSTSVSDPFMTLSVQVESWHTLPVHTWLRQSSGTLHGFPAVQRGQVPPPQSTPVSTSFFTPSPHVGV
jgi:hypothetical protein